MQTSLPPQCDGIPLIGWDWATVDGEESASGTTWGSWEVTGTWDGEALTLTEPPGGVPQQHRVEEGPGLTTPCPTPAGGWAPVDPSKVSVDVSLNQVRATVYVATPDLMTDLERRFGDAVAVTGLLEPVG